MSEWYLFDDFVPSGNALVVVLRYDGGTQVMRHDEDREHLECVEEIDGELGIVEYEYDDLLAWIDIPDIPDEILGEVREDEAD